MLEFEGLHFEESISAEEIQKEVARVAEEINRDYAGKEPLFVCVLNGAFMYAADLLKNISLPCEITFVRLKSYEGTETTGEVNMLIPLQVDVEGRDVIVIEDIVDTGITMHAFKKILQDKGAKTKFVAVSCAVKDLLFTQSVTFNRGIDSTDSAIKTIVLAVVTQFYQSADINLVLVNLFFLLAGFFKQI